MERLYRAAREYVRVWDVAIDGGAHVGTFSRVAAKDFGVVHAFEPHMEYAEACQGIAGVETHRVALGKRAGSSHLRPGPSDGAYHLCDDSAQEPVTVITLDSLDLDGVGLIKLDVEGFERPALKGAARTIARDRPVVIIEERRHSARYGIRPRSAGRWLAKQGYRRAARVRRDEIWVA